MVVAVTILSVLTGLAAGHLWNARRSLSPAVVDGPPDLTTPASSRSEPPSANSDAKRVDDLERDLDPTSLKEPGTRLQTYQTTYSRTIESNEASSADRAAEYPPHGSAVTVTEAQDLLTGTINFQPGSIPSSDTPVDADAPLTIGQDLQVKWQNTWWAGSVVRFEQDGKVRIHYFGWSDSWDEPKSRTELQLDRQAEVRAIDSVYERKGW